MTDQDQPTVALVDLMTLHADVQADHDRADLNVAIEREFQAWAWAGKMDWVDMVVRCVAVAAHVQAELNAKRSGNEPPDAA